MIFNKDRTIKSATRRKLRQIAVFLLIVCCIFWGINLSKVPAQNAPSSGQVVLPSIPSPVTREWSKRFITYSNVSINGKGNSVEVSPGQSINLKFDWLGQYNRYDKDSYCPGCIVQFYIGLQGNLSKCITGDFGNGRPYGMYLPPSSPGIGVDVNFKAPEIPGTYYITQNFSLERKCVADKIVFENKPDLAIAAIVVPSLIPSPDSSLPEGFWKLGTVINNTGDDLTFAFSVSKNQSINNINNRNPLDYLTLVGIFAHKSEETLSIDPTAHWTGCPDAQWRRKIQSGNKIWDFYYNLGTVLDIKINSEGVFEAIAKQGGQIVPDGASFICKGKPANMK